MESKIFGLVGHPVEHSISDKIHNAVFTHQKVRSYKYNLYDVSPDHLRDFMKGVRNFAGLNVTTPYKNTILGYLDYVVEDALKIRAVNTIVIGEDTVGYNTDYLGFKKSLSVNEIKVEGKQTLVLGAGGAARAIVYALSTLNASILLSNRSESRAYNLIEEMEDRLKGNILFVKNDYRSLREVMPRLDVIVNASSVGMHPNVDESPIDAELLHKDLNVIDIIYNPLHTKLIKDARKIGCKTVHGLEMLIYQGAESLRLWGIKPYVDIMREEALRILSP